MSLEEAILEEVRKLREGDKKKVLRFLDGLRHRPVRVTATYWDGKKEMEWIQRNRAAYAGLWVALDGDRLIVADKNRRKVSDAIKAQGVQSPFVEYILPEDELELGSGWMEQVD